MDTDRVVRVFISSTFLDMYEEREELVRQIFPELRRLCESRGVTCIEVDLRWGVTDDEVARGLALPICLTEARRCHVVVGLLGERYGSIAGSDLGELAPIEPWMAMPEASGRSITEWEILFGVLENPGRKDDAFFYFRDSRFSDSRTNDDREMYQDEDQSVVVKLRSLKDRIRREGYKVREDYADPVAAGRLIRDDLVEWIDRRFPDGSAPRTEEREATAHRLFAQLLCRHFNGRNVLLNRLDRQVRGSGPPLVVTGERGSGKSALLAYWVAGDRPRPTSLQPWWGRRSRGNPPLLAHFVRASPAAADWAQLLRRLSSELGGMSGMSVQVSDDDNALTPEFANILEMVARQRRVVIVIDGLDQLDDRAGALDLEWLPEKIPVNIRLIVSTSDGPLLDARARRVIAAVRRRGWQTAAVGPFDAEARRVFIDSYFASFGKHLDTLGARRLIAAAQTANPLFLRTVAEELRLLGDRSLVKHELVILDDSASESEVVGIAIPIRDAARHVETVPGNSIDRGIVRPHSRPLGE